MFNILTLYVRVAPATADVHFILQVPATDHDNNHIEDRYGLAKAIKVKQWDIQQSQHAKQAIQLIRT